MSIFVLTMDSDILNNNPRQFFFLLFCEQVNIKNKLEATPGRSREVDVVTLVL